MRGPEQFQTALFFDGTKIFIGGGLTRNHSETNYDCYVIDVCSMQDHATTNCVVTLLRSLVRFPVDMGMCHLGAGYRKKWVIKVGRKVLAWSLDTEGPG